MDRYYVFIFETFEEEIHKLKQTLDDKFKVYYTQKTIQTWLQDDSNEQFREECPACIISIRTQSIIPENVASGALFQQNFETKFLNVAWDLLDPKTNYNYSNAKEIENNPYVASFDITIYKNTGITTGYEVTQRRSKVFEEQGIKTNSFNYTIPDPGWRNYSIDVVFNDIAGNQSSGTLVSRNPLPTTSITGSGIFKSNFSMSSTYNLKSKK